MQTQYQKMEEGEIFGDFGTEMIESPKPVDSPMVAGKKTKKQDFTSEPLKAIADLEKEVKEETKRYRKCGLLSSALTFGLGFFAYLLVYCIRQADIFLFLSITTVFNALSVAMPMAQIINNKIKFDKVRGLTKFFYNELMTFITTVLLFLSYDITQSDAFKFGGYDVLRRLPVQSVLEANGWYYYWVFFVAYSVLYFVAQSIASYIVARREKM